MLNRVLAFAAAVLLAAGVARAADQPVFGKKLLIKNPPAGATANKAVHLAKDPNMTVGPAGGVADPQCTGAGGGGTSSLRIAASGGAGDVTIPLPCASWTTNGANNLYRYKDSSGATCKLVLVKGGVLLKAVCRGAQVAIDLNGSMSPVSVVATLNSERYCTEFGGVAARDGSDDKTFLRKNAPAPSGCPLPIPVGTSTTSSSSTTSTSSSSTTSTAPEVIGCCADQFDACFWRTPSSCTSGGGTPGAPGTVCDGMTGECETPPAEPGPCCDGLSFGCANDPTGTQTDCENLGGTYSVAVCTPTGCL